VVAGQQMFVAGQQRLVADFLKQLAGLIQEQWGERQLQGLEDTLLAALK